MSKKKEDRIYDKPFFDTIDKAETIGDKLGMFVSKKSTKLIAGIIMLVATSICATYCLTISFAKGFKKGIKEV